jgi:hypothetical protein
MVALLGISCATARAQTAQGESPGSSTSATEQVVLVRMLEDGKSFRVRARAALSLARFGSNDVIVALEGALSDKHPAVRTAAASALAQNGNRRSVSALRNAAGDREPAVAAAAKTALQSIAARSNGDRATESAAADGAFAQSVMTRLRRAQHVVVLGEMHDRTPSRSRELSELLGEQVGAALTKVDRVAVLRAHELTTEAREEIAKKKLAVLKLEGNLQSVQPVLSASERRVRCEVSVLLLDEGTGALRSMMRGAASAVAQRSGSSVTQEKELARKALRSAVQTAMSTAQEAIRRAEKANEGTPQVGEETALLTKKKPQ